METSHRPGCLCLSPLGMRCAPCAACDCRRSLQANPRVRGIPRRGLRDQSSDGTALPRHSPGDTAGHTGSESDLGVFGELGLCQSQPRMLSSQSETLPGQMKDCFSNFLIFFFFPQLNVAERSEPKRRESF